jgi:hypothetical protein
LNKMRMLASGMSSKHARGAGEDRDTVPCALTSPNGTIASFRQLCFRKLVVAGLQFLKTHGIWPHRPKPVEQIGQAVFVVVDIEGRDFYGTAAFGVDKARSRPACCSASGIN